MKAILIMGSTADEPHAKKITDKLDDFGISWEQHAASAHKQPLKVLDILDNNKTEKDIVQYELWDMVSGAKFKGGNFQLDLNSKPTFVTARNLIITQIRKYCHNYSKEC